jgi:hypothetical protein
MKGYPSPKFRPVLGIAAVALSALTMVLAVGIPAGLAPEGTEAMTLAVETAAPAAVEVAIDPARVEVVGIRASSVAVSPARAQSRRS